MYINQIDEFFDVILNKFNEYLIKENVFEKTLLDNNFVKFQNNILKYIKTFVDTISRKQILDIIKKESYVDAILNIIKRYCGFYIYLGIAYYYKGNRDLFITNMVEISRFQKDAIYQIPNFFNSENNSKIITFYNDIKNIIYLSSFKTMDKIKIILINNPLKYNSTIVLFNDLGEDYIVDYFLIQDNFHNIIKALIFKQIYLLEDKNEIFKMITMEEKQNAEYRYIEIIVSNHKKIIDFNIIQQFVSAEKLNYRLAEEIYSYLEEGRNMKELLIKENQDFVNYLFDNMILVPITEDFLRFHKDTEKYDTDNVLDTNIKDRDATRIKFVVNKINNVKNYYSTLLEKNPKLKLDTEAHFYKPLQSRLAILYNDYEELKIIQKLELSENVSDYDLLIDLENIRKYAYVNFKHFKNYGIKIRPRRTIQGIRSTNIQQKNQPLELRIGHNNIDMNVVGVAYNPSRISLDCFKTDDMLDVRKVANEKNGYHAFTKIMKKTFNEPNQKLYYWLFDNNIDKPILDSYVDYNKDNADQNIKIMLEQIYNNYIELVYNKINNYFNTIQDISISNFNKIMYGYSKKYFDFNLDPIMKSTITESIYENNIKELEIIPDDIDSIIPGRNESIIKLPVLKIEKSKVKIIKLDEEEIGAKIDLSKMNEAVCYHYIKWREILRLAKNTDVFNQAVFEFVKQYVRPNKSGDYTCKSCHEMVQIHKYVFEGTFSEEGDVFLTTNIAVTEKLEKIPKYDKYKKTIKNIEKNIEKIAYSLNIYSYMGNTDITKLRRKMVIKDTIDLILLHSEHIKKEPKDRKEQANKKYGINKELSNLFFFELTDNIFMTSSTDTDYYKLIKFNNVIAYLIYIMLSDINSGQLLSLKPDKKYNLLFFTSIKEALFSNLFLRINVKEKIPLLNLPLFAYILYYISGMLIANRFWLWNDTETDPKRKLALEFNLQKSIIHTVLDLINSIAEANYETNKNFLYEIINTRFSVKLSQVYNDNELFKRIEILTSRDIKVDMATKKITYTSRKVNLINLVHTNVDYKIMNVMYEQCTLGTSEIIIKTIEPAKNNFDILTNCPNGAFHRWDFKNNNLICNLCKQQYNDIVKNLGVTSSEKDTFDYMDKLKFINLKKLSHKYCITGQLHEVNQENICNNCKANLNTINLSDKELLQLEKNIQIKTNEASIIKFNKLQEYNENMIATDTDIKKILNKLSKRYETQVGTNLENYIIEFVTRLSTILGNKIKVDDKTIYLKENIYIIDHDYMGNIIKTPLIVLSSEDKIKLIHNHPSLNKDVIYYKDQAQKMYVYYDSLTLQYIGYSLDNKTIKKNRNNASLRLELSVKDCIMMLGYENQYLNINNILNDSDKIDNKSLIIKVVRNRIKNLKQIISRTQSILYNIINSGKKISAYNLEEKTIIAEFTKKLKHINTSDTNGHNIIFKHHKIINHRLTINYNIPENVNLELNNNYLHVKKINNLENSDCKLIFYLIFNFNRILDYNKMVAIESELAHLLIKIIKYLFKLYHINISDYHVRKFDFLINTETPYIDEAINIVGPYNELLSQQEIDDPDRKEANYDEDEAKDSLDIDDYEADEGDDVDASAEALDGFED